MKINKKLTAGALIAMTVAGGAFINSTTANAAAGGSPQGGADVYCINKTDVDSGAPLAGETFRITGRVLPHNTAAAERLATIAAGKTYSDYKAANPAYKTAGTPEAIEAARLLQVFYDVSSAESALYQKSTSIEVATDSNGAACFDVAGANTISPSETQDQDWLATHGSYLSIFRSIEEISAAPGYDLPAAPFASTGSDVNDWIYSQLGGLRYAYASQSAARNITLKITNTKSATDPTPTPAPAPVEPVQAETVVKSAGAHRS